MPRNVSGTYSLPLPPVVPNTVIQAAWANTTTDDIAQGITDSLDRNGRGGMIAPFRLVDGTVLQPAFAFASETGTGIYKASAGIMGVAVMGVQVAQWSSSAYNVLTDFGVTGNVAITGDLSFLGNLILTGDVAVDGNLGLTGTISVSGGLASLDDISVDENFDGAAGFFATNISTGVHSYAVFRANNNVGHAVGLAAIGTANTDWPANSDTGILFSDHAQGISLAASAASSMIRFYTAGFTEKMRLTAAGSLGIGGAAFGAPWEKLNLYDGNITITNAFPGAGNTPANRYILFNAQNSFGGTPIGNAGLGVQFTRVSGDTDYGSDLLFFAAADNSALEYMRITRLGNVGIGTAGATVDSTLHVKRSSASSVVLVEAGAGTAGVAMKANTAAGNSAQLSFASNSANLFALGAGSVGSIGVADFGLYSYANARNIFAVTASNGFFGINNNAPSTMLQVDSATSGVSGLRVAVAGASNQGQITIGNCLMQGGDDYVGFNWVRSVTTLMHLDANSGNLSIGMGATSGSVRLHAVAPGAGARCRMQSSDSGGVTIDFLADGNTSGQMGTSSSHPITFYTAFAVRLSLGAGTFAPVHHVYNNVYYTAANDPGPTVADIPLGGIIMGRASGAFTGCTFGSVVTFSGSQFVSVPGLGGGAAQNITTGQWRFCGHDTNASNLDVSLWMKIAY
jgi:hypothetical protein